MTAVHGQRTLNRHRCLPRACELTRLQCVGYYRGSVGPMASEEVVPLGGTAFAVLTPQARRELGMPGTAGCSVMCSSV